MKYAIIKAVNGAFSIDSEWSDLSKAKATFHGKSQSLWSAGERRAFIAIVDEQLDVVEGYKEFIHAEATATE